MTYAVKEIFYTLQGEGANAGRPAVFCRFAGCNLWTGREKDRATAVCTFCDTDFVGTDGDGGGKFRTRRRARGCRRRRRGRRANGRGTRARRLHRRRAAPAARRRSSWSRSTRPASRSRSRPTARSSRRRASTGSASAPRPGSTTVLLRGNELKLVYPQPDAPPERFATPTSSTSSCSRWTARTPRPTRRARIEYCLAHPQWRLSLQTHKFLGIR